MADLAKLVVRLELQSAQLLKELDKTNAKLSGFERRIKGFGSSVKGALAIFAGAVSFNKIITASAEAAKNFANLENAVLRAGDAAGGRTARDFAKISEQLQSVTTFSDDSIQSVQQLLLRFQSIRTDRFDEATVAVLDLSTALGTDAESAAKLLGKALSDPEKGMTALAKAGVIFSEKQKKVIKDLVDTGRLAEAQGLILDELAGKFGGAAEAARNNFAGALAGVKNAFDNLLEIDGGLPGATKHLNEFAALLEDPETKAAADTLFSAIVVGATTAAAKIAQLAHGVRLLAGGEGSNQQVNLERDLERLLETQKKFEAAMAPGLRRETNGFFGLLMSAGEAKAQIVGLNMEIENTRKLLAELYDNNGKEKGLPVPASTGELLPDIVVTDGLSEAAEKARKQIEATGKALTESLRTPLEKYNAAVAEADKLLAANAITVETWTRALGDARGELDGMAAGVLEVSERFKTFDEQLEEFDPEFKSDLDKALGDSMDESLKEFEKAEKKAAKGLNVFAEQASRNMQDILADGLETALHDGLEKGAKGALEAFGKMLERMALQAIAAQIAAKIFGDTSEADGSAGGLGGGGGWLDKAISWGASLFGSRDAGGRGAAGVPVMIGRGAQPEVFVPDSAGDFYPKGQWGGGGGANVTQNIYTTSPITQRSARQLEIEAARNQRVATARFG